MHSDLTPAQEHTTCQEIRQDARKALIITILFAITCLCLSLIFNL